MSRRGTGLDSLLRREQLALGYPLRDPRTGTVRVSKGTPSTARTRSRKSGPSVRDAALKRSATRKWLRSAR